MQQPQGRHPQRTPQSQQKSRWTTTRSTSPPVTRMTMTIGRATPLTAKWRPRTTSPSPPHQTTGEEDPQKSGRTWVPTPGQQGQKVRCQEKMARVGMGGQTKMVELARCTALHTKGGETPSQTTASTDAFTTEGAPLVPAVGPPLQLRFAGGTSYHITHRDPGMMDRWRIARRQRTKPKPTMPNAEQPTLIHSPRRRVHRQEQDLLPPPGRTETTTKEARLHKFEHNHNKTIDYHNNSTNLIKFEHSHSKTTDYHNNSPNLINDKPGGDPTNKFSSTYQLNTVKNLLDLFGDSTPGANSRTARRFSSKVMASITTRSRSSTTDHRDPRSTTQPKAWRAETTTTTTPSTTTSTTSKRIPWWFNPCTLLSQQIPAPHPHRLRPATPTPPRDQGTMTHSGGPPLPSMDDLDQQAAAAVAEGRAPAWQIEGDGPSMRSSVRVDDNSHDLSWVQGATPRTLPPPMPLHPQTVLSMRGSITGSWRGTTWSPPSQSVVRHPPRQTVEPTLVIYKTLASQQTRGVLPDGLYITIHRAGDWIATTRFELGFARTPRYWLVVVDAAPQPAADQTDRLPLRPGDSFWLEWRGQERIWQRRPRFHNDIHVLGGFATIPETEAPRPPTPPQRRDPTTQRAQTSYQGGFKSQRFVDTRPLRGRLITAINQLPLHSHYQQSGLWTTTAAATAK